MILSEHFLSQGRVMESNKANLPEGVLCRATYQICTIGEKNRNNRVYEQAVWDRVLGDKEIQEKLKNRSLFFHAEHPTTTQSNTEKVAGVVTDIQVNDSKVNAIMEVLDTPYGRIVDTLLKAGCGLGVSTRADGELEEMTEGEDKFSRVIPESYRFVTIDFTADPSTYGSEIPIKVERDVAKIIKQGLDSERIDREYATVLLEKFVSHAPEAIAILESIKHDKHHKMCKCKTTEKKCTKGCSHAIKEEIDSNLVIKWIDASPSDKASLAKLGITGEEILFASVEDSNGEEINYIKVDGKRYREGKDGKYVVDEKMTSSSDKSGQPANAVAADTVAKKSAARNKATDNRVKENSSKEMEEVLTYSVEDIVQAINKLGVEDLCGVSEVNPEEVAEFLPEMEEHEIGEILNVLKKSAVRTKESDSKVVETIEYYLSSSGNYAAKDKDRIWQIQKDGVPVSNWYYKQTDIDWKKFNKVSSSEVPNVVVKTAKALLKEVDEAVATKKSIIDVARSVLVNGPEKFEGSLMDAFTASAIMAVYNALSDDNKKKYESLPLDKLINVTWKLVGNHSKSEKVSEAEELNAKQVFDMEKKDGKSDEEAAEATLSLISGGLFDATEGEDRKSAIKAAVELFNNWGSKEYLDKHLVKEDVQMKIEIDPKVEQFLLDNWDLFTSNQDAVENLIKVFKIGEGDAKEYVEEVAKGRGTISAVYAMSNERKQHSSGTQKELSERLALVTAEKKSLAESYANDMMSSAVKISGLESDVNSKIVLLGETVRTLSETKILLSQTEANFVTFKTETEKLVSDLKESNATEIKRLNEAHTTELIKTYVSARLNSMGLKVGKNALTLLESCKTQTEVDSSIKQVQDVLREGLVQSAVPNEITVNTPVNKTVNDIDRKITTALEHFGA